MDSPQFDEIPHNSWLLVGDGAANIVLRYVGPAENFPALSFCVLRLKKNCQNISESNEQECFRTTLNQSIPEKWICPQIFVQLSPNFQENVNIIDNADDLKQQCLPNDIYRNMVKRIPSRTQPTTENRLGDISIANAFLMPDMGACPACTFSIWSRIKTFHDIRYAIYPPCHHSYLAVEIKPKSCVDMFVCPKGMTTSCSAAKTGFWCRHCCHQQIKLEQKKWTSISSYCPIRLFSGNSADRREAIQQLVATPQNNFRVLCYHTQQYRSMMPTVSQNSTGESKVVAEQCDAQTPDRNPLSGSEAHENSSTSDAVIEGITAWKEIHTFFADAIAEDIATTQKIPSLAFPTSQRSATSCPTHPLYPPRQFSASLSYFLEELLHVSGVLQWLQEQQLVLYDGRHRKPSQEMCEVENAYRRCMGRISLRAIEMWQTVNLQMQNPVSCDFGNEFLLLNHLRSASFKDCSLLVNFCSSIHVPGSYRIANNHLSAKVVLVDLDYKGARKIPKYCKLMQQLAELK